MLKARRKNFRSGTSRVLAIPAALEIGTSSTLAADRIMLVDPQGTIDEGDLLKFLEAEIEPKIWRWLRKRDVRHD